MGGLDPPELSVLVVSWNTRDLLRDCLRSLMTTLEGTAAEVIVIDNDSADASAAMVAEEFAAEPRVRLVANPANVGFAAGNNQALSLARGNVVAVVNPDTVFEGPVLAELTAFVQGHPEVGIATCNLVGLDGRSQSLHRAFPTLPTVFFVNTLPGRWIDHRVLGRRMYRRSRLLNRPRTGTVRIDQAAGALLVIRRELIDDVGGLFDERLPLYFNDVDLSRRVRARGLDVVVRYDLTVLHHGGGSLNQLEKNDRDQRLWDGLCRYYRLHEPRWRRAVLVSMGPLRGRP